MAADFYSVDRSQSVTGDANRFQCPATIFAVAIFRDEAKHAVL
ncbi:hypothetical protein RMSM_05696 [Rhodopirellula maiorica SM1]|uniref:Uncharacterized protein n=1 Tax=Rhodopirellula maiorica SM1 TaxID=1265738 RepID=M5RPS4_9BACT|nr:hypothetical protein RMSM_05696 [Rhodopirellula maiorica SM1]